MNALMRDKDWGAARATTDSFTELNGATLGILGVGTIGRRVAQIASQGFRMKVIGTSRRKGSLPADIEEVSLDQLFARSDELVICCSLTDETRGLVNAARIAQMKPDAVLINVSRGAVVENAPLIAALKSGKLGGAALDVFDTQPLPADDALFDCPNLLLTQHAAALTASSSRGMAVGAAEEMLRILRGEQPLNLVNPGHKAA
jgi:D-3-phosphoglycerate dehydrogenase